MFGNNTEGTLPSSSKLVRYPFTPRVTLVKKGFRLGPFFHEGHTRVKLPAICERRLQSHVLNFSGCVTHLLNISIKHEMFLIENSQKCLCFLKVFIF